MFDPGAAECADIYRTVSSLPSTTSRPPPPPPPPPPSLSYPVNTDQQMSAFTSTLSLPTRKKASSSLWKIREKKESITNFATLTMVKNMFGGLKPLNRQSRSPIVHIIEG